MNPLAFFDFLLPEWEKQSPNNNHVTEHCQFPIRALKKKKKNYWEGKKNQTIPHNKKNQNNCDHCQIPTTGSTIASQAVC